MSGGIDSSVAAARLKDAGYEVIGFTMKLWEFDRAGSETEVLGGHYCSPEMFEEARRVCRQLGIPHYVLNMKRQFEEIVVNDFISEYLQGRTPNPCILCNSRIKWQVFEHRTRQLECDHLATGHYARISCDAGSGRYQLRKGLDPERDQTYFLWGLTQQSLARTLFPLGEMKKREVREFAQEYELTSPERKESREVCFVPDDDYPRLLKRRYPDIPGSGNIRDMAGNIVGEHRGYYRYTIGQRKGIEINTTEKHYVVSIDPEANEIVVGSEDDLWSDYFEAVDLNWVSIEPPEEELPVEVKIRYRHEPAAAQLTILTGGRAGVRLSQRQRAITPGQSAVFYDGDLLLGGGRIA